MIAAAAGGNGNTGIAVLVAVAGSGVVAAIIQALFARRKTKAETESAGANASKLITDAATNVMASLQTDNTALRVELAALRADLRALERWRAAAEENFAAHERWDAEVAALLRERGDVLVGNPPSLRPIALKDDAT